MRRLLLAIVVVCLSGCGILPATYREPSTGPVATITYRDSSARNLSITLYDQSEECTGRRLELIEPGDQRTIKVRAGEKLTFTIHLTGGLKYCLVNLRFAPVEGAVYQFDTIDDPGRCLWRMLDMSTGQPQLVGLQKIVQRQGWDGSWSPCSE